MVQSSVRDHLLQLLSSHAPEEATERAHLQQMREWVAASGAPWQRSHFPAHFTASALIVTEDGAGVWLVLHAKLGRWLQPGGHLEPEDEGWLAGAQREAEEETGLRVSPAGGALLDVDVHPIPARRDEPAHFHADGRFLFRALSATPRAQEGEALEVKAFTWDQALALPAEPAFHRLLRKARSAIS